MVVNIVLFLNFGFSNDDLDISMQFDSEALQVPQLEQMDRSMEDSLSLGDIMEQNSAGSFGLSGVAEDSVPVEPDTLLGGMFNRVKNMIRKQDDNGANNHPDVSQQTGPGNLGESGISNTAQQSSQHLAGGYILPQSTSKGYVL